MHNNNDTSFFAPSSILYLLPLTVSVSLLLFLGFGVVCGDDGKRFKTRYVLEIQSVYSQIFLSVFYHSPFVSISYFSLSVSFPICNLYSTFTLSLTIMKAVYISICVCLSFPSHSSISKSVCASLVISMNVLVLMCVSVGYDGLLV